MIDKYFDTNFIVMGCWC